MKGMIEVTESVGGGNLRKRRAVNIDAIASVEEGIGGLLGAVIYQIGLPEYEIIAIESYSEVIDRIRVASGA